MYFKVSPGRDSLTSLHSTVSLPSAFRTIVCFWTTSVIDSCGFAGSAASSISAAEAMIARAITAAKSSFFRRPHFSSIRKPSFSVREVSP